MTEYTVSLLELYSSFPRMRESRAARIMKTYCVYIMASKKNGTIYVGSTSDLPGRVTQHKLGLIDGFTKKYGVNTLVYYEAAEDAYAVVTRERQLKKWNRDWKIQLIEKENPGWLEIDVGQGGLS